MNVKVVYKSRHGHTKRLAEAIARGAGVAAESVETVKINQPIDLLFIGGALYVGKIDKALEAFLRGLNAGQAKKAVMFGTSGEGKPIDPIHALLGSKNIPTVGDGFYCKGGFLWSGKNKPTEEELGRAEEFAAKLVKG